jgi:hypothetical protein
MNTLPGKPLYDEAYLLADYLEDQADPRATFVRLYRDCTQGTCLWSEDVKKRYKSTSLRPLGLEGAGFLGIYVNPPTGKKIGKLASICMLATATQFDRELKCNEYLKYNEAYLLEDILQDWYELYLARCNIIARKDFKRLEEYTYLTKSNQFSSCHATMTRLFGYVHECNYIIDRFYHQCLLQKIHFKKLPCYQINKP